MSKRNPSADRVPRVDFELDDSGFSSRDYDEARSRMPNKKFKRLKCSCGSRSFEVLLTRDCEVTAQCTKCGSYYVVHERWAKRAELCNNNY